MPAQLEPDGEPWGKYDRDTGERHHLAHHMADVAAVWRAIIERTVFGERLSATAGRQLNSVDIARLTTLVFLHDVGKLFPGFQAKAWRPGVWRGPLTGHVAEALDLLCGLCGEDAAHAVHGEKLLQWGPSDGLLAAVLAHHGRPLNIATWQSGGDARRANAQKFWVPAHGYHPSKAATQIGNLMSDWFKEAFATSEEDLPGSPQFQHAFAGSVALADWIGSDREHFRFAATLQANYYPTVAENARKLVTNLDLSPLRQRAVRASPATFHDVSGFEMPNAQQALVGATPLDAHLVILEAETGSGKTEAALWRYIKLFEAGKVDGLYFAVPTRAAAKQLHSRVKDACERLFGDDAPQVVLAIPGYLKAGEVSGTRLPNWQIQWDDDEKVEEQRLMGRWAAEDTKRYLAAQVAVGTVDQAMLGGLMIKHAHVRAMSLSRSLLVIDEVHASDAYMTAVQRNLVEAHVAMGGYTMLMSATLGSVARTGWLGQVQPDLDTAVAAPYPAVWSTGAVKPRSSQDVEVEQKSVQMRLHPTMAPAFAAQAALDAARRGARVLVIRNLVDTANRTLAALEELAAPNDADLFFQINGVRTLHHSRFAPVDRELLDAAVERALSKDRHAAAGAGDYGCIVIGTQTLEQSLDLDADFLITDLCPIDVLLQRIGRLHRHKLERPDDFCAPQCLVLTPEDGLEPLLAPAFNNGLGAWEKSGGLEGVYENVSILELTRRLIEAHNTWHIPEMNRALVEGATHPDAIATLHMELGEAWVEYHRRLLAGGSAESQQALLSRLDHSVSFLDLKFPDAEEIIRTRLGAEGPRIQFDVPYPTGPFGELVDELVLPEHLSRGYSVDDPVLVKSDREDCFTFFVGDTKFIYDRSGFRHAATVAQPADGSADQR